MDELQRLQSLIDLLDTKTNADELVKGFDAVLQLVEQILQGNNEDRQAITSLMQTVQNAVDKKLASLKDGNDGAPGKDGEEGAQGPKGDTGEQGPEGPAGLAGKDGSPDFAEDIRNKLEVLKGDERLDASAIKNLPAAIQENTRVIGGHGPLSGLIDVDVVGITTGQSIKWDGIRWIPFTPSGANTSVFGEAPTDSGDQTNFTLAHTPASGTLRLYRGGAYQINGVSDDYTLSGATITLSSVLQTGEKLRADYEY